MLIIYSIAFCLSTSLRDSFSGLPPFLPVPQALSRHVVKRWSCVVFAHQSTDQAGEGCQPDVKHREMERWPLKYQWDLRRDTKVHHIRHPELERSHCYGWVGEHHKGPGEDEEEGAVLLAGVTLRSMYTILSPQARVLRGPPACFERGEVGLKSITNEDGIRKKDNLHQQSRCNQNE